MDLQTASRRATNVYEWDKLAALRFANPRYIISHAPASFVFFRVQHNWLTPSMLITGRTWISTNKVLTPNIRW